MLPLVTKVATTVATKVSGVLSDSVRAQGRKIFKLGTFNVRGLTKDVKQKQLSNDMTKYGLDVACIQETKISLLINKDVDKNKLICTESLCAHYGLGFMVAPRWKDHIYRFWRVNDRISVLQLKTDQPKRKEIDGEKYSFQRIRATQDISVKEPVVNHSSHGDTLWACRSAIRGHTLQTGMGMPG